MNLVIVAGGLGSRLAPMTNFIPKFLVNIGKNTGYVEMMRYWDREDPTSVTVIVHSKYASLVAEYHKMYFKGIELIIKTVDKANGSADAILSTCSHLDGKPAMFVWCDVIPDEPIPVNDLREMYDGATVVFTNYKNSNRYGLRKTVGKNVEPYLDKDERGGCFGMYFISKFRTNGISYENGQDFIDVIHQYGPMREYKVDDIIDFGDLPKLERTRSKADEAREFNSVEYICEDYVLKQAANEQGVAVIEREIQWYEKLGRIRGNTEVSVPKAWAATDKSGFFMTRVQGVPVWKAWPMLSGVDRLHVLQQIIDESQKIFDLGRERVDVTTVVRDVCFEAQIKLLARYDEIKGLIASFGEVHEVNGIELTIDDPTETIMKVSSALEGYYSQWNRLNYGFIHGDLQMSNSMVDLNTMKVTIIDPRGYFGKTVGSGLRDYDTGKLLYALSGYDLFNYSKNFGITKLQDGRMNFAIPTPSHKGIAKVVGEYFKPVHRLWLAVCWLGLAQYVKNDPVKSVAAHYHGLTIAESALRGFEA